MFDWLITNAKIVDGSGGEPFRGDVAVADGKIAAVGKLSGAAAVQSLEAGGKTLTPGFVDIHRHGDAALFRPDYGKAELTQGITTAVNGNCGLSLAPAAGEYAEELLRYLTPITGAPPARRFGTVGEYLREAEGTPLRLNTGILVGGGTLRANVTGFAEGELTGEQYRRLHALLEGALADGALGVSLGLGYAPECFYTTDQLVRALEPLRDSGRVVTVHMRQEGDGVTRALAEMIEVARALRTPTEISHLKAIGRRNWRRAVPRMLEMIRRVRDEGLDVTCDVYPYTAGSTQLMHVLPPEFQSGGTEALTAQLRDEGAREVMRARMEVGTDFENISLLVGFENIQATGLMRPENRQFEGWPISDIANLRDVSPYDALFDLLAAEHCQTSMIDFITTEEDIAAILREPFSCVISDAIYPSAGLLHPRVCGMTAHLLEHFVREESILTLPQAVRKLTRLPADRLGLNGKGRIEAGADADLLLFDPDRVCECATYSNPMQLSQGMDWVFVGGVPAISQGELTQARTGRVLRNT